MVRPVCNRWEPNYTFSLTVYTTPLAQLGQYQALSCTSCIKVFYSHTHTHTDLTITFANMASIMMLIAVVLSCVYLSSATYLPPCGPPDAPGYGSFYPQKKFYSIGKVVRFSCRDGFLLKGYSFTKCIYSRSLRKAVWKFDTPVCKRELVSK